MKLTRRAFNRGVAAAAAALLPVAARATVPPRDEARVLARATDIDLSAQETAVVFAPVPPPRRPPQKPKLAKGEKPKAARTWIVLRDVVVADRAPAYDLFLVLEGTNVFAPKTTTQPVGALVFGKAGGDSGSDRKESFAFDVTEALARLAKTRGFNMRYLRLTIVRRATDASGAETAPSAPAPPEIGTIELVRW
jgi:hypothetical protein